MFLEALEYVHVYDASFINGFLQFQSIQFYYLSTVVCGNIFARKLSVTWYVNCRMSNIDLQITYLPIFEHVSTVLALK